MTYEELKKIAQPHIREKDNLPSNALLLLTQLHITYKTEKQCEKDFEGKYNPLDNHPAFLFIKGDEKILYFKTTTRYYNFYIFHELSHYILGHEDDCPQNELDANMLACILAAPIENLPTSIYTAKDLSSICQIPIDRAEEYWEEIRAELQKRNLSFRKNFIVTIIIVSTILSLIALCFVTTGNFHTKKITQQSSFNSPNPAIHTGSTESQQNPTSAETVMVTVSGTKYHLPDCKYVEYKTNAVELTLNDALSKGYNPCKICIK